MTKREYRYHWHIALKKSLRNFMGLSSKDFPLMSIFVGSVMGPCQNDDGSWKYTIPSNFPKIVEKIEK